MEIVLVYCFAIVLICRIHCLQNATIEKPFRLDIKHVLLNLAAMRYEFAVYSICSSKE